MTMFAAEVTQYLLPDGRQKQIQMKLPADSEPAYRDMRAYGCRLEGEVLFNGEISLTVFHIIEEYDVDIELVPNGPAVRSALIAMLARGRWTDNDALSPRGCRCR